MIELPCPKRDCKESILRRNLSEHLSECAFETVPCKYTNIGCTVGMVRRDLRQLKEHEGDSHQHLQLAIDAIQQQQSTIRDMTKEALLEVHKMHLDALQMHRDTLRMHRDTLQIRKHYMEHCVQ